MGCLEFSFFLIVLLSFQRSKRVKCLQFHCSSKLCGPPLMHDLIWHCPLISFNIISCWARSSILMHSSHHPKVRDSKPASRLTHLHFITLCNVTYTCSSSFIQTLVHFNTITNLSDQLHSYICQSVRSRFFFQKQSYTIFMALGLIQFFGWNKNDNLFCR